MDKEENKNENVITYEVFSRAYRNEKNNPKLEQLPENFYPISLDWLKKKKEVDKGEYENAKRLLKKIFEKREKKIMLMAMHAVRSDILPKNLLPEEKKFFDDLVEVLKSFNKELKEKILDEKLVETSKQEKEPEEEKGKESEKDRSGEESSDKTAAEKPDEKEEKPSKEYPLVRSLEDIPKFVGTDEKNYGPLKRGDVINLPKEIVEFLEKKGKVERAKI